MYRWEIAQALRAARVVAIVRTDAADEAVAVGRALLEGGIEAVEVSLTVPGALDAIATLAAGATEGVRVGAGTVLDAPSARAAILAGASFLVAPTVTPEVIATAARYGCVAIPGAATATEAVRAAELGADFVKLFPANGDIATLTALRAALPQIPFVPTGGIDPDDVPAWLDAGAAAVGLGGALTQGDADQVRRRAAELVDRLAQRA